jgi:hypothetical protein
VRSLERPAPNYADNGPVLPDVALISSLGALGAPIGRRTVVEDPFGNRLVLLDSTKGTYDTDESGAVTGVS